MNNKILISIVICTYRRPDYIIRVLDSLVAQKLQNDVKFEVILVENDLSPSNLIKKITEPYSDKLPLRVEFVSPPNLSIARNFGGHISRGDYIAYLDDDTVASPYWLENLNIGIKQCSPDVFCGPIFPLLNKPKPKWFNEEFELANQFGNEDCKLSKGIYLVGANFGITKTIFDLVGGFSPKLGMKSDTLGYGEETLFVRKAWELKNNLNVVYFHDVSVLHEIRSQKLKLTFYLKSAFIHARDSAKIQSPNLKKSRYFTRFVLYITLLFLTSFLFIGSYIMSSIFSNDENKSKIVSKYFKEITSYIYSIVLNWYFLVSNNNLI